MKTLISMTDFVLEQFSKMMKSSKPALLQRQLFVDPVMNYAQFLKTPLNLGMFVPCDEDGNVLEEPIEYQDYLKIGQQGIMHWGLNVYNQSKKYQKAEEKVLFNGFKKKDGLSISDEHSIFHPFWNYEGVWKISKGIKTIEDLIPYNLELTENFKP